MTSSTGTPSFDFQTRSCPWRGQARKRFIEQHGSFDEPGVRQRWRKTLAGLCTQTRGEAIPGYGPSGLQDNGHADGLNAHWAAEWIERRAWGSQPFLIAVGFRKPHVPFVVPQTYFDLYDPESLLLPPRGPRSFDAASKYALSKRYRAFGFDYEQENLPLRRAYTHAYLSCLSFADAQIGVVLDALESANLTEDTLILLASDNGYLLGEYRMWGKDNLYENCVRVPLIVSAPGWMKSPGRTNAICELIDIFPTVCQWCGVEPPAVVQGMSLAPVLQEPNCRAPVDGIHHRQAKCGPGKIDSNGRMEIHGMVGAGAAELLDSTEKSNRIDDDRLQDLVIELRERLASAAQRAQDAPRNCRASYPHPPQVRQQDSRFRIRMLTAIFQH